MSLREKLTDTEKRIIETYIDKYAASEGGSRTATADHILRIWEREKSKALANIFGGQLIITRPITFKQDIEETCEEVRKAISENPQASSFLSDWRDKFGWHHWEDHKYLDFIDNDMDDDVKHYLYCLCDFSRLATNRWDDDTFVVPFPDGTTFKVQHGTKISKAIGKIAKAFEMSNEQFEAFRIACSQGMNQKEITGNLTLSIHPLDYMTMSDNDCGWSSCMSWTEKGCYRQGTVEMMNSPMVIVAYITADDRVFKVSMDQDWNSKKWRELFIVTPDMICNILGYPYRNSNISQAAINLIKELAEKNLGWSYGNEQPVVWKQYEAFPPFEENKEFEIEVRTETGWMYNDFSDREHFGFFGKSIDDGIMNIYYSGPAECMLCGMENPDLNEESCLAGECCEEIHYCDCCGERIYDGDMYYIDDLCLCSYCADDRVRTDSIYHEDHFDENVIEVVLLNEDDEKTYSSVYIYQDDFDWNTLKKYFNKLIAYRPYRYGGSNWCVRATDLTPEGQKLFCEECGYNTFEEVILSCERFRLAHLPSECLVEYSHDRELQRW